MLAFTLPPFPSQPPLSLSYSVRVKSVSGEQSLVWEVVQSLCAPFPSHPPVNPSYLQYWQEGSYMCRGAKFTENTNDQWSSAARVSVSKCTNPWYMTHSASFYHQGTEASLLELRRFMTLCGLGFPGQSKYHWLAASGISGLSTHESIIKIQHKN